MNLIKTFLLLIPILFTYSSWGHGDHHLPGAKPPAPHGGTVEKAAVTTKTKHSHGQKNIHNHADTKKAAIFFEVNLKKDILNIYALMLDAETHKTYSTIKTSDFRNFKINI